MQEKGRATVPTWAMVVMIGLSLVVMVLIVILIVRPPTPPNGTQEPVTDAAERPNPTEESPVAVTEPPPNGTQESVTDVAEKQNPTEESPVAVTEPPPNGTQEPVTGVAQKQKPTEESPEAVTEPLPVTIVLGYTELEAQELLTEQIQQFSKIHPDIEVSPRYIEKPETLMKAVLSGEVDVAALPYNEIGLLYQQQALRPFFLEGYGGFLVDAVQSITFDGYTYGLPWRRSACRLHYYYLVIRKGSAEDAEALTFFLTDAQQQDQRYDQLGWFPTLTCCYTGSGCYSKLCGPIECPDETEHIVQRLPLEQIGPTIALAEARLPNLAPVLGNIEINTAGATALIEGGVRQATGAPARNAVSSEEFRSQLREEGAYVGVLFVDTDPEYPPGDYAVLWKCEQEPCQEANSQVKVYLIPYNPQGKPKVLEVQFERFEDTNEEVGPPFCQIESGSWGFCWGLDGLYGCLSFGG
jgi:hypothetical protein